MNEGDDVTKTILIAEGLNDSRMFMRMALERHGYRVLEAETGGEAVDVALRERPDLILIDLHPPALDGLEATRRIRAHGELRGVPVVGTSTSDAPELEAAALAAGCTSFRRQPIDFDKFGDLADLILSSRGEGTGGAEVGGREAMSVEEAGREVE